MVTSRAGPHLWSLTLLILEASDGRGEAGPRLGDPLAPVHRAEGFIDLGCCSGVHLQYLFAGPFLTLQVDRQDDVESLLHLVHERLRQVVGDDHGEV